MKGFKMINRRNLITIASSIPTISFIGSSGPAAQAKQADTPGTVRWTFVAPESGISRIQVSGSSIYGSSSSHIYALDASNGEEQWTFLSEGAYGRLVSVANDNVHAVNGGKFYTVTYAIDAITGEERWRVEAERGGFYDPVDANGVTLLGQSENEVTAFDSITGIERWRFRAGSTLAGTPLVNDGAAMIGSSDGNMYAVDIETGEEMWRFPAGSRVSSPTSIVNGVIFFGGETGVIYAVDAVAGTEIWRFQADDSGPAAPYITDDSVLVRDWEYGFVALDINTGLERWRNSSFDSWFAPAIPAQYDDIVIQGGYSSHLSGLDAATGIQRWFFEVRGSIMFAPVVHDGTLYVGDSENVYAIAPDTGKELWRVALEGSNSGIPQKFEDIMCVSDGLSIMGVVAEPPRGFAPRDGETAITVKETSLLAAPLPTANLIETLPPDTLVEITGASAETGGITWWPATTPSGNSGWIDGEALQRQ